MALVEDPDLVVDQLNLANLRVELSHGAAQRAIEGVDRAVPGSRALVALVAEPNRDRGLAGDLTVGLLLDRHAPAFEAEERLVLPRLAAHQKFKRTVRGFKLVAEVLELFDAFDDSRASCVVEAKAGAVALIGDRCAACKLRNNHVAAITNRPRLHVFESAGVGADAGSMHSRLVGEGVLSYVWLGRVWRPIEQLVDKVGGLC